MLARVIVLSVPIIDDDLILYILSRTFPSDFGLSDVERAIGLFVLLGTDWVSEGERKGIGDVGGRQPVLLYVLLAFGLDNVPCSVSLVWGAEFSGKPIILGQATTIGDFLENKLRTLDFVGVQISRVAIRVH